MDYKLVWLQALDSLGGTQQTPGALGRENPWWGKSVDPTDNNTWVQDLGNSDTGTGSYVSIGTNQSDGKAQTKLYEVGLDRLKYSSIV